MIAFYLKGERLLVSFEGVKFARDSPLEGSEFELPVPRSMQGRSNAIIAASAACHRRPIVCGCRRRTSAKAGQSEISEPKPYRVRNRKFESISLQRGVSGEPCGCSGRAPPSTPQGNRTRWIRVTSDVYSRCGAFMPNLLVVAAILLCAPLVAFAQTSTTPSPAASPHSTVGTEATTVTGTLSDQGIKTKLESLGYTQVTDIVLAPEGATAKAMKGDKPMTIAIDSAGKVTESQIGP